MNHAESGRVGELVLLSQHSIAEEETLRLTFLDSPLIAGAKTGLGIREWMSWSFSLTSCGAQEIKFWISSKQHSRANPGDRVQVSQS